MAPDSRCTGDAERAGCHEEDDGDGEGAERSRFHVRSRRRGQGAVPSTARAPVAIGARTGSDAPMPARGEPRRATAAWRVVEVTNRMTAAMTPAPRRRAQRRKTAAEPADREAASGTPRTDGLKRRGNRTGVAGSSSGAPERRALVGCSRDRLVVRGDRRLPRRCTRGCDGAERSCVGVPGGDQAAPAARTINTRLPAAWCISETRTHRSQRAPQDGGVEQVLYLTFTISTTHATSVVAGEAPDAAQRRNLSTMSTAIDRAADDAMDHLDGELRRR